MTDLDSKEEALLARLRELGRVAVAFSGGVDSTLLAAAAQRALGDQAVAVTADWIVMPRREIAEARELAAFIGIRHLVVDANAVAQEVGFRSNPSDRCYHCKRALAALLREVIVAEGFEHILHGEVADDVADYRPGKRAAEEAGLLAPLAEVGLTKAEVRALSARYGLPTADKPSYACLATRVPYGQEVTVDKLAVIEHGEELLHAEGLPQVRLRHHGDLARIEAPPDQLGYLAEPERAARLVAGLRALGFHHVTLDLAGYRTGSLNEQLPSADAAASSSA